MSDPYSDFGAHPRNIQYALKAARLLNQTESGIAKVFADQSENFLERQYGTVIVALDLDFSSDQYDIGEVIGSTLMTEYYTDLNRSAAASFEHALTAVNQRLADLAAAGQNAWVGKLNALVGVIHENEIHLSLTGRAEAFLVRGPSVTHITADLHVRPKEATAKTFLSVASGELEVGDKLLVTTGEVMNHLSQHDVRRHLYLHPPNRAIRRIADQLTEKRAPDRLAAVVAELTTIDLVSAETLSDEPDAIVLGAPRGHFESLGRLRPFREDTPFGEYSAKARKYYDKRIAPRVRRSTGSARKRGQDFLARRRGEVPTAGPKPAPGTPETESRPAPRRFPRQRLDQVGDRVRTTGGQAMAKIGTIARPYYRRVGTTVTRLWQRTGIPRSPAWMKLRRALQPLTALVGRLWTRTGQGRRASLYRNLLIGGVLVLGLSLVLSIRAAGQAKAQEETRTKISAIQEQQAKAEASFIFKDVPAARSQIVETQKAASTLPDKILKAEVLQLRESVNGSYDRIFNITVASGDPLTDFGPGVIYTAQSGTLFYGMGTGGELKSFNQADKQLKTANPNPVGQGQVKGVATTASGSLLLLTDQPSVVSVANDGSAQTASLAAGGSWEPGVAIDTVAQNLYVLDPEHNQVWRHTNATSGFGKGEPYLTEPTELTGAADLVTGTQIYVLRKGQVIQLTGGKAQPLTISGVPAPNDAFPDATELAVNYSTNLLYIADPAQKRVLELNAKGEYQRQFVRDTYGDLTDLAVDDKTNILFTLVGGKLYQQPLAQ